MPRRDLIIIGAGPAGLAAVETAREAGASGLLVVESGPLGGECPNRGCIPTKSLLHSVAALRSVERAAELGIRRACRGFDLGTVIERREKVIQLLTGRGRIEGMLKKAGAELVRGRAKFVAEDAIEVGGRRLQAEKFVIAAGAEHAVPPIAGLAGAGFVTSDQLVRFKILPRSLAIIGGGPIGVEMSQIFAPLGTEVTIIEYAEHILPREDAEIAAIVAGSLKRQGIRLLTGHKMTAVSAAGGRKRLEVVPMKGGGPKKLSAETLLVAVGKRPALASLEPAAANIRLDKRGWPEMNEYLQSVSNPRVYFAGDAAGRMMYTSVAHHEGEVAANNAVNDDKMKLDLTIVPRGTFCRPEIGSVGLTEVEAAKAGHDVAVGRANYAELAKGLVDNETEGLIKIVADRKTGLILGGHIAGRAAADLVHEIALAMYAQITCRDLANMIHAFPTYAEGIGLAAGRAAR